MERTLEQMRGQLEAIRAAPTDAGVVRLIVLRPGEGRRQVVPEAVLDVDEGLVGDSWRARGHPRMPDGLADPQAQLTLVNARAAAAIAGDVPRWPLAGDQLFVDLDLSTENLPAGTRLSLGEAEIELSAKPHTGCAKYAARFGTDAIRFVGSADGQALRLRGANARAIRGGMVRVGDRVQKAR